MFFAEVGWPFSVWLKKAQNGIVGIGSLGVPLNDQERRRLELQVPIGAETVRLAGVGPFEFGHW